MSEWIKPIVTVDVVVLTLDNQGLCVMLTERDKEPFKDRLALPGGYLHTDEDKDTEASAHRVLRDKAGVEGFHIEQLQTFSGPKRDPRGYSVSISYLALVPHSKIPDDAILIPIKDVIDLAFDHDAIVAKGVERLRKKAVYSTAPAALLERPFTLPELHGVYEAVLDTKIDLSSFRRKMLALSAVDEVGTKRAGGRGKGPGGQLFTLPDEEVRTFDRTFGGP